jgi:hypothetical protein
MLSSSFRIRHTRRWYLLVLRRTRCCAVSASLEKGGVVAGGARPSRLLVLVASSGVGAATSVQDDAVEHRHRHLNPTMQTLALVRRSSPFFTLKLRLKFRTSAAALDSSRRNVL